MAASNATSDNAVDLTALETVSDGYYVFDRPLTIVTCALNSKYVCYESCHQCTRKVLRETKGHHTITACPVHGRQKGAPVYKYAWGILLGDRKGVELWVTAFDTVAHRSIGLSANDYMSLKTPEERCNVLTVLHGKQTRVTIRKSSKGGYANYSASALEVVEQ